MRKIKLVKTYNVLDWVELNREEDNETDYVRYWDNEKETPAIEIIQLDKSYWRAAVYGPDDYSEWERENWPTWGDHFSSLRKAKREAENFLIEYCKQFT